MNRGRGAFGRTATPPAITGRGRQLRVAVAGVAEYVRQWLLLARRRPFRPGSGEHRLVMAAGGSAGHSGCWDLDVDEGVPDEEGAAGAGG